MSTVIRVGGDARQLQAFADFFDGNTATVRRAEICIEETGDGPFLVVLPPETEALYWPLADIRRVPDQAARDTTIISLKDDPVSRLILSDEETQRIIVARCENLNKRPRVANRGRLVTWSIGAIASVALIIFVLVPLMADQLADFLPPEGEKALGDVTFDQIRTALADNEFLPVQICENPDGLAALNAMQTRLSSRIDLPYPLQVAVLDHELINAFALPGGRVVLFRGLIEAAQTPDEVAGVLAHEIGHVVHRDPARGALRSAGSVGVLGLLFGDFAGGTVVLFLLNRLIDATYSQEAEALADSFAHETLSQSDIAPSALADMFERLRAEGGETEGILAHFMAHPELGDRIDAARQADSQLTAAIRPSLSAVRWQDLQSICD